MIKHWSVELPAEMIEIASDAAIVGNHLRGYTGTIYVQAPADFMRNTIRLGGEHDSTDAESQAAVARLVVLARGCTP